jgi:hypothetical protein
LNPFPCIYVHRNCPCYNMCLFFRRLKINHEPHEFILDPGTVANNTYAQQKKSASRIQILTLEESKSFDICSSPKNRNSLWIFMMFSGLSFNFPVFNYVLIFHIFSNE